MEEETKEIIELAKRLKEKDFSVFTNILDILKLKYKEQAL